MVNDSHLYQRTPEKHTYVSLPIPLFWPVISSPQLSQQSGWLQRPDILQRSEIQMGTEWHIHEGLKALCVTVCVLLLSHKWLVLGEIGAICYTKQSGVLSLRSCYRYPLHNTWYTGTWYTGTFCHILVCHTQFVCGILDPIHS